jgi:hypothetical protein
MLFTHRILKRSEVNKISKTDMDVLERIPDIPLNTSVTSVGELHLMVNYNV